MPNKDGTGPRGEGSRTGRQKGNCKGAEFQPGNGRKISGRGRSCRRDSGNRRE